MSRGRALATLVVLIALIPLLASISDRSVAAATTGACQSVVVSVDWDQGRAEQVSGVVVRVSYPAALEIPIDTSRPGSAQDRVQLVTSASGGLFDAVPRDSNGDGRADVVSIGLIKQGISAGEFARIGFDCASGTAAAKASDFSCVSDVADQAGSVPSSCRVALATD